MTAPSSRCRSGGLLALAGSALGVVAGIVQVAVGTDIPDWSGAKSSPGALGLLTVALSALVGAASLRLQGPTGSFGGRLGASAFIVVVALVCFTTVGRLWFVPGPLMLVGAALTVPSWSKASAVTRRNWIRILVAALGACELLMAAGAAPIVMAVGVFGGAALISAALVAARSRPVTAALLALGTIPFAATAWTALVPVLVLVVTAALAVPVLRTQPADDRGSKGLGHAV